MYLKESSSIKEKTKHAEESLVANAKGYSLIFNEQFVKAAQSGDLDKVKALVSIGKVDPKVYDSFALRYAARNGHLLVVEFLLPCSDVAAHDYEAFRMSARNGHRDAANFLQPFVPWEILKYYV